MIYDAWSYNKLFIDALNEWRPNTQFQAAMDMYMGTQSTYSDISIDYQEIIQSEYSLSIQRIGKTILKSHMRLKERFNASKNSMKVNLAGETRSSGSTATNPAYGTSTARVLPPAPSELGKWKQFSSIIGTLRSALSSSTGRMLCLSEIRSKTSKQSVPTLG